MNADEAGSRRQFFTTMLAGALGTGSALLATFGRAGSRPAAAKPNSGGKPGPDATTSDEVLAAMNDLTGILEP